MAVDVNSVETKVMVNSSKSHLKKNLYFYTNKLHFKLVFDLI